MVRHRASKKEFAAKYIRNFTENLKLTESIYREIAILNQLTKMGKSNCFTTNLIEVVIAGEPESFNSLFLIIEKMP